MSVIRTTKRDLLLLLDEINDDDEIVVCRDPEYAVHSDITEFDGIVRVVKISVREQSSVYVDDPTNDHQVWLLSPIE